MENFKSIEIEKIEVKKLFGSFDYTIETSKINSDNKLLLIYGDNGSGKTTILKLVFYLLSSQDKAGHKSAISKIKFQKFSITLSNNITVSAIRENAEFGTYKYVVSDLSATKPIFSIVLNATKESDYSVQLDNDSKDGRYYLSILKYLADLNIKLFYLSDTRKALNTGLLDIYKNDIERTIEFSNDMVDLRLLKQKIRHEEPDIINITIKSLEYWFKSEALKASNIGEQETNNIYLQIVKQITKPKIKNR